MRAARFHFDRFGAYLGYVDPLGHYFDKGGTYRGAMSADGSFFDEKGVSRGRFDILGQYWDESGTYRGYLSQAHMAGSTHGGSETRAHPHAVRSR